MYTIVPFPVVRWMPRPRHLRFRPTTLSSHPSTSIDKSLNLRFLISMNAVNTHTNHARPRGRPCKPSSGTVDSVKVVVPFFSCCILTIYRRVEEDKFVMPKEHIDHARKISSSLFKREMLTWRMQSVISLRSCIHFTKPDRIQLYPYQSFQRQ